jgi:hypothetical protein
MTDYTTVEGGALFVGRGPPGGCETVDTDEVCVLPVLPICRTDELMI